jgi:hypothetical protein
VSLKYEKFTRVTAPPISSVPARGTSEVASRVQWLVLRSTADGIESKVTPALSEVELLMLWIARQRLEAQGRITPCCHTRQSNHC